MPFDVPESGSRGRLTLRRSRGQRPEVRGRADLRSPASGLVVPVSLQNLQSNRRTKAELHRRSNSLRLLPLGQYGYKTACGLQLALRWNRAIVRACQLNFSP